MQGSALRNQRTAHPTKKGPGRRHGHKVEHPTAPKPPKGAGFGFVLHVASAEKRARKAAKAAAGGHRQAKRLRMAPLRAQRDPLRAASI